MCGVIVRISKHTKYKKSLENETYFCEASGITRNVLVKSIETPKNLRYLQS